MITELTLAPQVTDYYFVRRRQLHVPMLYQNEGIYRYKGGVNWRAVVSLVITIPINLPGLINAIDKSVETGNHKFFCTSLPSSSFLSRPSCYHARAGADAFSRIDRASWFTSFFIAGGIYLILSKISPPHSTFVDKTVESLDDELPAENDPHGWAKQRHSDTDSDEKVISPISDRPPHLGHA